MVISMLRDVDENLWPVAGIRLGVAEAAIKRPGRTDLLVVELDPGTVCSAVFTQNAFCAAPVTVAREHLQRMNPRFWLVNSGNANAGTGSAGLDAARQTCAALGRYADCDPNAVLPFSTGVIGVPLPVERITAALPAAVQNLSADGWRAAAQAIMTTDTIPKWASRRVRGGTPTITVTGIAKGAGMIRPDLATMLAFIATDAAVPQGLLARCLAEAVAQSFNRITVDGDTSTNDACIIAATGQGGVTVDQPDGPTWEALSSAVGGVCRDLARAIVWDAEGATRFVAIAVTGGRDEAECRAVAYTIAHSPLVKTALFAGDPNWGRVLAALGRAGLPALDISLVEIYFDTLPVFRNGTIDPEYQESVAAAILAQREYTIRINLGRGAAISEIWTCDLSYDYVRINAEYRS